MVGSSEQVAQPAADALAAVTGSLPGGGEQRPGQVEMAEAVEEALVERRHLVVQAGTGTGKSLAYLVPAAQHGSPVIVATATKALQEQLARRDVPLVEAALGSVSTAVLKGRSNYLCLQKVDEITGGRLQPTLEDQGPTTGRSGGLISQVRSLVDWSTETKTGDLAELGEEISPQAWSSVSTGPSDCPGASKCPRGHECFTERARAQARGADIIVTNLHLLGADLASDGAVLPEHDVVIIDEAHALEEVMTQCLGIELSPNRIRTLASEARSLGYESLRQAAGDLGSTADGLVDVLEGVSETTAIDLASEGELAVVLQQVDTAARKLLGGLQGVGDDEAEAAVGRAISGTTRLVEDLARLSEPGDGEVLFSSGRGRSRSLSLSPLDVGPSLRESLFARSTVVLTSATIPPRFARRLGLDESDLRSLDVGSPFDFRSQSLLYVPTSIGDRRSEGAEGRIAEEIATLIEAAGGRTLALFTSYRAMDAAAARVADRVSHPLLVQGQASPDSLIARFRAADDACLFATMGMWQGLDVPGQSLSLVTIDRLPFGRPDDPLLEARREAAGRSAFEMIDLPRASTLLAQGVGRLIRSRSDRGVVAVMDERLATAGYRSTLLDALPPMKRTRTQSEVVEFLNAIRDAAQ